MMNQTVKTPDFPTVTMDIDRFWEIVEKSREGALSNQKQAQNLEALLTELELCDIVRFFNILDRYAFNAHRPDLWAVATIMMDGCSDVGFQNFLLWLVSRGRKHYEAALLNPEKAADGVNPGQDVTNELLEYAPVLAYEAKTNDGDGDGNAFYEAAGLDCDYAQDSLPADTRVAIYELPCTADDLPNMYPELWKRFA